MDLVGGSVNCWPLHSHPENLGTKISAMILLEDLDRLTTYKFPPKVCV